MHLQYISHIWIFYTFNKSWIKSMGSCTHQLLHLKTWAHRRWHGAGGGPGGRGGGAEGGTFNRWGEGAQPPGLPPLWLRQVRLQLEEGSKRRGRRAGGWGAKQSLHSGCTSNFIKLWRWSRSQYWEYWNIVQIQNVLNLFNSPQTISCCTYLFMCVFIRPAALHVLLTLFTSYRS